jgi:mannose-6-phosphate isomerase
VPDVPYRVEKPWGYELIWARTDRYVGKILHVKAGHVLSLQYHNRKDETMHLLSGELTLRTQTGDTLVSRPFKAGESVHAGA